MAQELVTKVSSAMQYDFCPWANRYVYWLKKPIGWVVLAFAASLLLGIYVSHQAYLAAGIIAAVGAIGAVWPWVSMLGIRGELHWEPSRCEESDVIATTLILTNRWPWPAWGLVVQADDAIANQTSAPNQPISLSHVPAWSRSTYHWMCQPRVRGLYPKHSVRLSSAFPFGIWTCSRVLHVHEPLVVWPRCVRLSDAPENAGKRQLGIGGNSPRTGDDGDWMGVRPYREGDSLRQVHWAQTARRDSLIVFERQARSRQSVSIAIDPESAANCSDEERDWMVRILASVANHLMFHAWDVRVSMGDRWTRLQSGNRSQWMDQLAVWCPSPRTLSDVPLNDREASFRIFIASESAERKTTCKGQTCWIQTDAALDPDDGLDAVTDEEQVWRIPIHCEPEVALAEAWRRICMSGMRAEEGVAS